MSRRKTALVTGAGGYLGRHLSEELARDRRVIGAGRSAAPVDFPGLWIRVGRHASGLADAVASCRPDLVFDAAFVNRRPPGVATGRYLAFEAAVHRGLCGACAARGVPMVLVGSSAVYGEVSEPRAVSESTEKRPASAYGLAKDLQERIADHHATRDGLRLVTARLFNLLGPGRGAGTVAHDWMARLARILSGESPPTLEVLHLRGARDFVDPRDASRALRLLGEALLERRLGEREIFDVASGRAVLLRDVAARLLRLSWVDCRVVETGRSGDRSDLRWQLGDPRKLQDRLGWSPTIPWERSVEEIFEQHVGALRRSTR